MKYVKVKDIYKLFDDKDSITIDDIETLNFVDMPDKYEPVPGEMTFAKVPIGYEFSLLKYGDRFRKLSNDGIDSQLRLCDRPTNAINLGNNHLVVFGGNMKVWKVFKEEE